MKEKLKNSWAQILGLVYVLCCVISMGFFYVESLSTGINGFELVGSSQIGTLMGFAIAFQVLCVLNLILITGAFFIELLARLGLIDFEIKSQKFGKDGTIKALMLSELILSVILFLFVLLTIVTNKTYYLVFGAGTFLLMATSLVGYVVCLVLTKKSSSQQEIVIDITEEKEELPSGDAEERQSEDML